MLKHSELAIIKNNVLTVNHQSIGSIFRLLAMCSNPGRYDDIGMGNTKYVSDGVSIWKELYETKLVDGKRINTGNTTIYGMKTKKELESIRDYINNEIDNGNRYYEVEGDLYRILNEDLYYLSRTGRQGEDNIYTENRIPIKVLSTAIKGTVPVLNMKLTRQYNNAMEKLKYDEIKKYYNSSNMSHLGFTNIEGYQIKINSNNVIRVEVCDEDNNVNSLTISIDSVKELMKINKS